MNVFEILIPTSSTLEQPVHLPGASKITVSESYNTNRNYVTLRSQALIKIIEP